MNYLTALIKALARLWLLTEQLDPQTDPEVLARLTADVQRIVAEVSGLKAAAEEQPRLFPGEWGGGMDKSEQRHEGRIDRDLYESAAQFPAFFKRWAPRDLTLAPIELPSQFPIFAITEQIDDECKCEECRERARVLFSRGGWDDPGCTLTVRDWGDCGLNPFYPIVTMAIMPIILSAIPAAFADWLKQR